MYIVWVSKLIKKSSGRRKFTFVLYSLVTKSMGEKHYTVWDYKKIEWVGLVPICMYHYTNTKDYFKTIKTFQNFDLVKDYLPFNNAYILFLSTHSILVGVAN